ncbi:MAG: SPOR domain-containing protein, partial [Cereibacter changlensis]
MAGVDYDEYEGEYDAPQRPARVQRALNLAGGLVSVALILGLAVWGYKLAVRDVTGIPVVRAMEGPMRIAPEDPGGEIAAHQGLSVNDVAAVGVASPPPERLVLAPRPVELSLEDGAGLSDDAPPVEGEGSDELAMDAVAEEDPAPLEAPSQQQPEPAAAPLIEDPTRLAIAEALADTVEPLSADTSLPDPAALEDPLAEPEVEVAAAPAGAVTRSPRPPQRPASASAGVTLAAAAPAAAAPVKEVDPATLA